MQIAMHALGKMTLFMCAGAIYVATHKSLISEMRGLGRVMPVTFGVFFVGAMSIIGLPPLGGSWPKFFLMLGAVDAGQLFVILVLIVSSIFNVIYLLSIPVQAFYLAEDDQQKPEGAGGSLIACSRAKREFTVRNLNFDCAGSGSGGVDATVTDLSVRVVGIACFDDKITDGSGYIDVAVEVPDRIDAAVSDLSEGTDAVADVGGALVSGALPAALVRREVNPEVGRHGSVGVDELDRDLAVERQILLIDGAAGVPQVLELDPGGGLREGEPDRHRGE